MRLNGRLRVLERQARRMASCALCGRQDFHILDENTGIPPWFTASALCHGCGRSVKLIDHDAWDML
jgi:hypothetical protein